MLIECNSGDLGRYALIVGDPDRVNLVSQFLDDVKVIRADRQYRVHVGYFKGTKTVVASHSIGGPTTGVLVEELADLGVDTFIRAGTSGAIQTDCCRTGFVIATGAIRDEGTANYYLPIEFPAVPHILVVNALVRAAREQGVEYHTGVVQAKDSFYGEVEPERQPTAQCLAERWKAWRMGGALASEMESAALFIIGAVRKLRTGGIFHLAGTPTPIESMVLVGLNALKILADGDGCREEQMGR